MTAMRHVPLAADVPGRIVQLQTRHGSRTTGGTCKLMMLTALDGHAIYAVILYWVVMNLGKDAIDRRDANDAAGKGHEAQQQQVPAVGGGLAQVEVRCLSQLGGHAVVKVEEDGDDEGGDQGTPNVGAWHFAHILTVASTAGQGREPWQVVMLVQKSLVNTVSPNGFIARWVCCGCTIQHHKHIACRRVKGYVGRVLAVPCCSVY